MNHLVNRFGFFQFHFVSFPPLLFKKLAVSCTFQMLQEKAKKQKKKKKRSDYF